MRERVLVAMSGGVDSSVAAAMLVEQGYDVVGATMKLFCHDDDLPDRPCCSLDSVNDARRVCQQLGVPHYVLNLESAFGSDVVENFVNEYAAGRTPIPCVRCNTFTKFRDLLVKADAIDAKWIATGHYARVEDAVMYRGLDRSKDQSYFLWGIDRRVLRRMLLPVGAQTKAETRATAHALGLEVIAEKTESQDICFVPDDDYRAFLRRRAPQVFRPGAVVDRLGRALGAHEGIAGFTVGQKRGLGLATGKPLYVVDLDPERDTVTVGEAVDLERDRLVATATNFIACAPPSTPLRVAAKIRHSHQPAPATVRALDGDRAEVVFDAPQRAVSPGQSVVFYDGDVVVGGGVIARSRD
jgi:tRNA-specific 2-thiouridylase